MTFTVPPIYLSHLRPYLRQFHYIINKHKRTPPPPLPLETKLSQHTVSILVTLAIFYLVGIALYETFGIVHCMTMQ